jgi:DNA-directed RNA polymerase specialized sigma24 family protein
MPYIVDLTAPRWRARSERRNTPGVQPAVGAAASSYEEFYRRHLDEMRRALCLALGNPDLGTEATDEAMGRAWERWSVVASWAYRVGLNWGLSRQRRVHPKNKTFPGEVLVELAADAIDESGATRERPLEFEGIRKRQLPEDRAHTKAQHHKAEYALRAAAMVRAGVDPGLLDEVIWWGTDDLWFWALEALVIYVRASAERSGETVPAICGRIASRQDVELAAAT